MPPARRARRAHTHCDRGGQPWGRRGRGGCVDRSMVAPPCGVAPVAARPAAALHASGWRLDLRLDRVRQCTCVAGSAACLAACDAPERAGSEAAPAARPHADCAPGNRIVGLLVGVASGISSRGGSGHTTRERDGRAHARASTARQGEEMSQSDFRDSLTFIKSC